MRQSTLNRDMELMDWIYNQPFGTPKAAAHHFRMTVWAVYKAIRRIEQRKKDTERIDGDRQKQINLPTNPIANNNEIG